MLNKLWLALALATAISMTSCVPTYVANLQRTAESEVQVFMSTAPTQAYTELKYIQAEGSTIFHRPEKLLRKLTERAKKEGADAIINVKYDFRFTLPVVSGIAIKYK